MSACQSCGDKTYRELLDDNVRVRAERDEARAEVVVLERQNIELNDASVLLEKKLAESRAEVERLRELVMHPTGVTWEQHHLNFKFMVRDELNATEAAAYRRGAEAMREAAAQEIERQVDALMLRAGLAADIRALPVPEDKP